MEKDLNVYQRINAVMKEVKYVQKENKKVNGQYTFVSHDAVTAVLHGPLAENGIVMLNSIVELTQDGNRTAVKMQIDFVNMDEPTDKVTIYHWGYGIDPTDKGIGKAVSYAVKYALLKTFCLETGDDAEKDFIEHIPQQVFIDQEKNLALLKERKKFIMELAGEDNLEDLKSYIKQLKETFKTKTEEEIFAKEPVIFVQDFNNWKEKKLKVA